MSRSQRRAEAGGARMDFEQLQRGSLEGLQRLAAYLDIPLPSEVGQRLAAQIVARSIKRGQARKGPRP